VTHPGPIVLPRREGARQRAEAIVKATPILGPLLTRAARLLGRVRFPGTARYWEQRYAGGGHSGAGSYGELAAFKAQVLNAFVQEQGIRSIVEFGCGDGAQLSLARYPSYVGLDVSKTGVQICARRFAGDTRKSFFLYDPDAFVDNQGVLSADAALSLDVIYHLTEDEIFHNYMLHLFLAARRFVVIYSTDQSDLPRAPHVRPRKFSDWIRANRPDWTLTRHVPNRYPMAPDGLSGSQADFFVYARVSPLEAEENAGRAPV